MIFNQKSFSKGILSSNAFNRENIPGYGEAVRDMNNMLIGRTGEAYRRGGTFILERANNSIERIIPFQIHDESYVLIFERMPNNLSISSDNERRANYMAIKVLNLTDYQIGIANLNRLTLADFQRAVPVKIYGSGNDVLSVFSSYYRDPSLKFEEGELAASSFTQIGNVLIVVNESHAPFVIRKEGGEFVFYRNIMDMVINGDKEEDVVNVLSVFPYSFYGYGLHAEYIDSNKKNSGSYYFDGFLNVNNNHDKAGLSESNRELWQNRAFICSVARQGTEDVIVYGGILRRFYVSGSGRRRYRVQGELFTNNVQEIEGVDINNSLVNLYISDWSEKIGWPRAATVFENRIIYAGNNAYPAKIWFSSQPSVQRIPFGSKVTVTESTEDQAETRTETPIYKTVYYDQLDLFNKDQTALGLIVQNTASAGNYFINNSKGVSIYWVVAGDVLYIGTNLGVFYSKGTNAGSASPIPFNTGFIQIDHIPCRRVFPVVVAKTLFFITRDNSVRMIRFGERRGYDGRNIDSFSKEVIRDTSVLRQIERRVKKSSYGISYPVSNADNFTGETELNLSLDSTKREHDYQVHTETETLPRVNTAFGTVPQSSSRGYVFDSELDRFIRFTVNDQGIISYDSRDHNVTLPAGTRDNPRNWIHSFLTSSRSGYVFDYEQYILKKFSIDSQGIISFSRFSDDVNLRHNIATSVTSGESFLTSATRGYTLYGRIDPNSGRELVYLRRFTVNIQGSIYFDDDSYIINLPDINLFLGGYTGAFLTSATRGYFTSIDQYLRRFTVDADGIVIPDGSEHNVSVGGPRGVISSGGIVTTRNRGYVVIIDDNEEVDSFNSLRRFSIDAQGTITIDGAEHEIANPEGVDHIRNGFITQGVFGSEAGVTNILSSTHSLSTERVFSYQKDKVTNAVVADTSYQDRLSLWNYISIIRDRKRTNSDTSDAITKANNISDKVLDRSSEDNKLINYSNDLHLLNVRAKHFLSYIADDNDNLLDSNISSKVSLEASFLYRKSVYDQANRNFPISNISWNTFNEAASYVTGVKSIEKGDRSIDTLTTLTTNSPIEINSWLQGSIDNGYLLPENVNFNDQSVDTYNNRLCGVKLTAANMLVLTFESEEINTDSLSLEILSSEGTSLFSGAFPVRTASNNNTLYGREAKTVYETSAITLSENVSVDTNNELSLVINIKNVSDNSVRNTINVVLKRDNSSGTMTTEMRDSLLNKYSGVFYISRISLPLDSVIGNNMMESYNPDSINRVRPRLSFNNNADLTEANLILEQSNWLTALDSVINFSSFAINVVARPKVQASIANSFRVVEDVVSERQMYPAFSTDTRLVYDWVKRTLFIFRPNNEAISSYVGFTWDEETGVSAWQRGSLGFDDLVYLPNIKLDMPYQYPFLLGVKDRNILVKTEGLFNKRQTYIPTVRTSYLPNCLDKHIVFEQTGGNLVLENVRDLLYSLGYTADEKVVLCSDDNVLYNDVVSSLIGNLDIGSKERFIIGKTFLSSIVSWPPVMQTRKGSLKGQKYTLNTFILYLLLGSLDSEFIKRGPEFKINRKPVQILPLYKKTGYIDTVEVYEYYAKTGKSFDPQIEILMDNPFPFALSGFDVNLGVE